MIATIIILDKRRDGTARAARCRHAAIAVGAMSARSPYLAAHAALYADNDEVERIPPVWTAERQRTFDADCQRDFGAGADEIGEWQHVTEPFDFIFDTLETIWRTVKWIEEKLGIDEVHSIVDDCIEAFGTGATPLPNEAPYYRYKARILSKVQPHLKYGFSRCGSPIEKMMFFALLVTFGIYNSYESEFFLADGFLSLGAVDDLGDVILGQQVQLGEYRVDFLLGASNCNRRIVIECDGHDFHERTKLQAQRDKSRDRWLQTHGFSVLRFTGTEIYVDAAGSALEIFDAVKSLKETAE